LLTFFFRQMRALIERGFLYIAQPPLFKVKKGKSERYVKDEAELRGYLLELAMRSTSVSGAGSAEPLPQEPLQALLGHAAEYERLLLQLALRGYDDRIVEASVRVGIPDEAGLRDEQALRETVAPRLEEALREAQPDAEPVGWSTRPDPEHGGFRLAARTRRAGITLETVIDTDLLRSSDYQRLREAAERIAEVAPGPYQLQRDGQDDGPALPTAVALMDRIVALGKRGLSIQRYKGLGEMNPDQLAETTMNPTTRTLLQVRVEDAVEADEVFTTLMGDEVEPRRDFIERNALEVQNLDV
ncbi:MAG: DNA gyrase subunit B, partial [Myxococcota bacterium]